MRPGLIFVFACVAGLLAGCGGGGSSSGGSADTGALVDLGSISTRVVGASQPPVTLSSSFGPNATGIAGALFSSIVLNSNAPSNLADTRIAYSGTDLTGNYDIYSVVPDGTGLARLTTDPTIQTDPSWGAGGTKIVYASWQDGNSEIYIMNSNGTGQTRLTNDPGTDKNPCLSPDGTKIAFSSNRGGTYDIYVMNVNGTTVTKLFEDSVADETEPAWSPNGYFLAYTLTWSGSSAIWRRNANGANPVWVTPTDHGQHPAWSPDGTRIFFDDVDSGRIASQKIDGTDLQPVDGTVPSDQEPTFSPDANRLAFSTLRDGNLEIYTHELGGVSKNLTLTLDKTESRPAWSTYQPRGPRTMLGTGGPLGTAAAGFLFCQNGVLVNSILTFDTATTASRPDARIASQDNSGGLAGNMVFSITTSEGLGALRWVELGPTGLAATPRVLTIPAGTTGALVSFAASTGSVSSVILYTANRSAPEKSVEGDLIKFTGEFLGGWTRSSSLSSNGSFTEVVISRKTGEVVFHN